MLNENENIVNKKERSKGELNTHTSSTYELTLGKRLLLFLVNVFGIIIFFYLASAFTTTLPDDSKNPAAEIIAYALLFVAMFGIIVLDVPKLIDRFKNYKSYIAGVIGGGFLIGFAYLYTFIVNLFYPLSVSSNQEEINKVIALYPVCSIIFLGILGPFCEELGYRTGLFGAIKKFNLVAAFIIAPLVFALGHFHWPNPFTMTAFINELINLPVYIVSGLVLTFLYHKYGFAASCVAHAINNVISVIVNMQ